MDKIAAYTGVRSDVAQYVSTSAQRILDVGCSNGALGKSLKEQAGSRYVLGLEGDSQFIDQAKSRLDSAILCDLNALDWKLLEDEEPFDCIIFADVLEHLIEPTVLFSALVEKKLKPGGNVIISLPNASHYLTFVGLLKKEWPLMDEGIFDRTHLRWFSLKNITTLLEAGNLQVRTLQRKYRMVHDWRSKTNRWTRVFSKTPLRDYITYQYVVDAIRKSDS